MLVLIGEDSAKEIEQSGKGTALGKFNFTFISFCSCIFSIFFNH